MAILDKGLVQIYTGDGKGKTTAALGLVWRMLGWGGKVYVCQFLKPADLKTGEKTLAAQLSPNLVWDTLILDWNMADSLADPAQRQQMTQAVNGKLHEIHQRAASGRDDLIVLDEIIFCVHNALADIELLKNIIRDRARHTELVLTGRGADPKLSEMADLVSAIHSEKHPIGKAFMPGEESNTDRSAVFSVTFNLKSYNTYGKHRGSVCQIR